MPAGDATLIYDGVIVGAAINTAVNTAADGIAGENFVVIPNQNNGNVMVIHIEGT